MPGNEESSVPFFYIKVSVSELLNFLSVFTGTSVSAMDRIDLWIGDILSRVYNTYIARLEGNGILVYSYTLRC